jgi:hypothetical protein
MKLNKQAMSYEKHNIYSSIHDNMKVSQKCLLQRRLELILLMEDGGVMEDGGK